jgi:hypothetical protein
MERILKQQADYSGGMNSDTPSSEILSNEVAGLTNLIAFPRFCQDRPGCALLSGNSNTLPTIDSYIALPGTPAGTTTPYFHTKKVAKRVYLYDDEQSPQQLVEGNYLVWENGLHDQIHTVVAVDNQEYVAYFDSSMSGDIAESYLVVQTEKPWGAFNHFEENRIVVHLGAKLYYTDNSFTDYTEIVKIGQGSAIGRSVTNFRAERETLLAFNAAGIFRIIFDTDSAYYFDINSSQPKVRIYEDPLMQPKTYGRNRIYTLARILGVGATYSTAGLTVQQESAPIFPTGGKDVSKGFTDVPIDSGAVKYQELSSGPSVCTDLSIWKTYTNGAFGATIGEEGPFDIIGDFSSVASMDDVATVIQIALRTYFPYALCYFRVVSNAPQLVISGGAINGMTVGYATTPGAGTSITALLQMWGGGTPVGSIATVSNGAPTMVYNFGTIGQRWTHCRMYCSKDTGENGIKTGTVPDELIWARDIPIIKTFRATRGHGVDGYYLKSSYVWPTESESRKLFYRDDENSYGIWADEDGATGHPLVERLSTLISANTGISTNENETTILGDQAQTENKTNIPFAIGAKKVSRGYVYRSAGTTHIILDGAAAGTPVYTNTWNKFSDSDVGKLIFCEDGSILHLLSLSENNGEYHGYVHENVTIGDASTLVAFAWDPIIPTASADAGDAKIVTFDKSISIVAGTDLRVISGAPLTASDMDKRVYVFHEGDLVDIGLTVDSSPAGNYFHSDAPSGWPTWFVPKQSGLVGVIVDLIPPRFWNDFISDATLDAYQDDPLFLLQTRFFTPLPSTPVGEVGNGYIVAVEADTKNIHYSLMPTSREYIAGFHHPTYQMDNSADDIFVAIEKYPNYFVAFGKKSFWGTNVSSAGSITDLSTGEVVATLPPFSLMGNTGFAHLGSIQHIGLGATLLVMSDGSMRLFDGRQLSDANLAENKVWKIIRAAHNCVMSSYDGHGGYMLFASQKISSDGYNAVNATEGFCLRYACLASQGSGWSRYNGEAMVFPFPHTNGIEVYTTDEMAIQCMLDERTGLWYQINTYDGPSGSGLSETHTDKGDVAIAAGITLREDHGTRESENIEHMESHIYVRPRTSDNSYLTGFQIDSRIYKDGTASAFAQTLNTPIAGDFVYDRKAQGKRLQVEFAFTVGGFYVTKIDNQYVQRDTAGTTAMSARSTSEMTQQREYANPNLWITRGSKPLLNRATGELATGTMAAITGPDGVSGSGMQFDGGDGIALKNVGTLDGDFTIQFNHKFTPATP